MKNYIYIFGGYDTTEYQTDLNSMEILDMNKDKLHWIKYNNVLKQPRYLMSTIILNDKYVFNVGGCELDDNYLEEYVVNTCEMRNIETNKSINVSSYKYSLSREVVV